MKAGIVILLADVILISLSLIASAQLSNSRFRGAVVEYGAKYLYESSKDTVLLNVENYGLIVERLKKSKAPPEIIVFPELGLSSIHWIKPSKKEKIYGEEIKNPAIYRDIPCDNNDTEALKKLSCIAKKNSVYIVVNVIEKVKTNDTNSLLYNTNVVFDRQGVLIKRYRKFNIFGESGRPITKPEEPDYSYFDTDFGVRFGVFICFDIIFKTPALDLVKKFNITHFAFSTAWFSEQPFLTAVQEQAGWAYGTNTVLLASGYNDPDQGSTGSGIYFRNGDAESFQKQSLQVQVKQDFAIISWIPKLITQDYSKSFPTDTEIIYFNPGNEAANLQLKTDNLDVYTIEKIQEPKDLHYRSNTKTHTLESNFSVNRQVCNRGLCCEFSFIKKTKYCLDGQGPKYSFPGDNFGWYKYRLAAFNGIRTYDHVTTGGVQICSIINCLDDKGIDLCAKRTDFIYLQPDQRILPSLYTYNQCYTSFENVIIKAKFKSDIKTTFLTSHILLASSKNDDVSQLTTRYGMIASSEKYNIKKINDVDNSTATYEFRSNGRIDNPLTINLYNRVFDLDGSDMTTGNSSNAANVVSMSLLIISIASYFFNLL